MICSISEVFKLKSFLLQPLEAASEALPPLASNDLRESKSVHHAESTKGEHINLFGLCLSTGTFLAHTPASWMWASWGGVLSLYRKSGLTVLERKDKSVFLCWFSWRQSHLNLWVNTWKQNQTKSNKSLSYHRWAFGLVCVLISCVKKHCPCPFPLLKTCSNSLFGLLKGEMRQCEPL